MYKGKKILITGGTGSLGQALTKRLLKEDVDTIRIYSRNENKQVMMESQFQDSRLRFLIGDIRDLPRLKRALEDVDIVFHTAALKHVPLIEYNPFEAVKTNVLGTQNIIEACIDENVEIAVGVGTDKAVSPLNAYGATKLLMEKLFVTASNFLSKDKHKTKFVALRYGNVLGSSGSVIPKFLNQISTEQKITITDENMTRFNITMDEALDFILKAASSTHGGEIFVPKLKAYTLKDVKKVLFDQFCKIKEEKIPIRPGEKMHEVLINKDEMKFVLETDTMYVILNPNMDKEKIKEFYFNYNQVNHMTEYSSDKVKKIPQDEFKRILLNNNLIKKSE
jgi:UDP-N-acetylglucosamine 4,6-dehydratase/5-epimerase